MSMISRRWMLAALGLGALAACSPVQRSSRGNVPAGVSPRMLALVDRYADKHKVPRALVHRVVQRESKYNPAARNGPYIGMMQILPQTARTMGYRGSPDGLYDAETNLEYGVKYLRGAWLLSNGSHDRAVKWYASGYYYEAKRRGMLKETGLRS